MLGLSLRRISAPLATFLFMVHCGHLSAAWPWAEAMEFFSENLVFFQKMVGKLFFLDL